MNYKNFNTPVAYNEPVLDYLPGSNERIQLIEAIKDARLKQVDIPMFIGGKEVFTDQKIAIHPPHDRNHLLGAYNRGNELHVKMAIEAALKAKEEWTNLSCESRAAIFLKAASLLAGPYRAKMNAATMICQSKNIREAEIDSSCELIDFFRYNVQYMAEINSQTVKSVNNIWNRMEQRPLEGFVFALTPFNFTSIAGNLPTAPAIMGNTVVWKASNSQIYSARIIMDVLRESGLPDGVINLIFVSGPVAGNIIFQHPDFAGIHFTGSTEVFHDIWRTIGNNIHIYKSYPRIVGETGGKDFAIVHKSAKTDQVITALIRGAFEYQGQKCSALSRAYIPDNLWPEIKQMLLSELQTIKMGSPEDFNNFFNAVIDESSFDKLAGYINNARNSKVAEIISGGKYDKTVGYFIEPTVIVTTDPNYVTMEDELFGPVLTIYIYNENKYEETLEIVDKTSIYGLTGCVFAVDRKAIELATVKLANAAGNFYINDKPTGAVVGQQPFGGSRGSGTNDKAGAPQNLLRWVSPRVIKENFLSPTDYRYGFLKK